MHTYAVYKYTVVLCLRVRIVSVWFGLVGFGSLLVGLLFVCLVFVWFICPTSLFGLVYFPLVPLVSPWCCPS